MARVEVESEVTGTVWKVEVGVGDRVEQEGVIMIFESMKMEIPLEAPVAGTVAEILVQPEEPVTEGQIVAILES